MSFCLYYKKNKNDCLFRELEQSNLDIFNIQNYIPIYQNFFSLTENNFNSINLNHTYHLNTVKNGEKRNVLNATICDISNNIKSCEIFCKFSPLLDPLKLLTGKYDLSLNQITTLPNLYNQDSCIPKLNDKNNNSYVDGFFTYLSSQLLHNFNFIHGIDYYGSFLGIQKNFMYNIVDDFSYLNDSSYFHKNKNKSFFIDNNEFETIFNVDSRNNKTKLKIDSKLTDIPTDNMGENDFNIFATTADEPVNILDLSNICIYSTTLSDNDISDQSSCSSNSSNTNSIIDDLDDLDDLDDADSVMSDFETVESCEEDIMCRIDKFPIQLICLEKCENTLDYLMENELLNDEEWISCLFQIIIMLSIYQKTFSFTHNDLHTNNIMYIPTDKQYIYYTFKNTHYKVPTYGKLYKIIDYGRAIYKYNGKIMCSDSFHPKGDAATQYNCEPYMDSNKPRLEPNPSFDLSRLACCLFDYFVDNLDDTKKLVKTNKIFALIYTWLLDDKGRNILYKHDGSDRYVEFKLYKMIARTIHNAIPETQLKNDLFKKYIITEKNISKKKHIINLDIIPILSNEIIPSI
jgi:hypothetical protein